jgi:hypothetical protein
MTPRVSVIASISAALLLPACPRDHGGLALTRVVTIPGLVTGGTFSYDVGWVDPVHRRYYLTDRTNKALDIVNLSSYVDSQVKGFTGVGSANETSGPDGLVLVPGSPNLYLGDVNTVKVVSTISQSVTSTITTGNQGFRSDEGCLDPDDDLILYLNDADTPPHGSFISTRSNTVIATYPFSGPQFGTDTGTGGCVYDRDSKSFFINNAGTSNNPTGELDVIPASSVLSGAPQVTAQYSQGECNPNGLALNPRNRAFVVGCDTDPGTQQRTLIMSAKTGAILATLYQVGGSDQVAYDPHLDRFYIAARNMTANGISQTGQSGAALTPVLGIIDATSFDWIANIPTGVGSHSVAVNPTNGEVFIPVPPTSSSPGGVRVYDPIEDIK